MASDPNPLVGAEDLNSCSQRYQTNVDSSAAVVSKLDTVQLLYKLHAELTDPQKDVFLCERLPKCRCKNECTCDSDDFVALQSAKFDLGSNCTFICEFISKQDRLGFLVPKKTDSARFVSTIRIFTMPKLTLTPDQKHEEPSEVPVLDIVRPRTSQPYIIDHLHKIRYDLIEDPQIQDRSMIFRLNYMSWRRTKK